uniref:Uncharacterized protein n=1 Tax=Mucochytrium quahogii TaxID=96639 RepID=A0A7S2WT88_9STRA|mmetsp:Transcript_42974/g.69009  ORF Transcript_42974/g.69009 Transcript_42974/m.69009 type:complete len:658 (-) Transcript_42974:35-2008(-)
MVNQQLAKQFQPTLGDFNGFVQLFFDNTATVLGLVGAMNFVLRGFASSDLAAATALFPAEMGPLNGYIQDVIFGRAIPGLAITMIFGNVYYAFMGAKLGVLRGETEARATALPYGVNTPAAFAFVFAILGPVVLNLSFACTSPTTSSEAIVYEKCWENAVEQGWRAGVVSNFVGGLIATVLSLLGDRIRDLTPAVALLTCLAGIGVAFLGLAQVSQSYSQPLAGLLPLYLVAIGYFADVSFGVLPVSLAVVVAGIVLGWSDGILTSEGVHEASKNVKFWGLDHGFSALGDWSMVGDYIGTTLPVALAAVANTLMNVHSAECAGDKYPLREALVADGIGTIIGSLAGTPFPTSVYIGHPAIKKMGAGVVYSLINCFVFFFFGMFGLFSLALAIIPMTAVAPLLLFVGMMICQEAIASASVRMYPAYMIGLFPALADWATQSGVDHGSVGGSHYFGYVAMSKSSLLLSLLVTSTLVYIIDRKFLQAAAWCLISALFSVFGIIHQNAASVKNYNQPQSVYCVEVYLPNTTTCPTGYTECGPNFANGRLNFCGWEATQKWRFATGYAMCAVMLLGFYGLQRLDKVAQPILEADPTAKSHVTEILDSMKKNDAETESRSSESDSDSGSPSPDKIDANSFVHHKQDEETDSSDLDSVELATRV